MNRVLRRPTNPDDGPREKLDRLGARALGDNELLAVLLGGGPADTGSLGLADAVLAAAGGLHGLLRSSREELLRIRGLGLARATQVLAALELGRRGIARRSPDRVCLGAPRDAARFLMPEYSARPVEQVGLVLLDTRHRVLRTAVVAVGSVDSASVQPRDVFRQAMLASATALVLFHNHPSGDPRPSAEDVDLTRRMVAAGDLVGISLLDHIVLGDGRYCSMREAGYL
jgi:DNA repair protein RadC